MKYIVIAGKDWQARALLRAQLLNEGFDVEGYETISDALAALRVGRRIPNLLIADISASDDFSADLRALAAWSGKVPIWVIASRTYTVENGLEGHGFETILLRPVDIGKFVEQVKRRLARRQ